MKLKVEILNGNHQSVAPLVGAWIEINADCDGDCEGCVAPLVGAWIEIRAFEETNLSDVMSLLL